MRVSVSKSAVTLLVALAAVIVISGIFAAVFPASRYFMFFKPLIAVTSGALLCAVLFQFRIAVVKNAVKTLDGTNTGRNMLICEFPENAGSAQRVKADIKDASGKSICKVVIYYYDGSSLSPGDKISAKIKLSGVEGSTGLYYLSKGIYMTGTVTGDISVIEKGGVRLSNLHLYVRNAADRGLDKLFGEKSYFIRGLLFGDKSGFDESFSIKASDVGVSHIFAVSGMNLSFIVTVIMLLGRKKAVYAAAIAGVAAFMAISGFSASVVRAGIMQIAALVAFLFGRESESFSSLALSLLVMLALNPFAAADIGLQFSFASVVGILTIGKKLDAYFRERFGLRKKFVEKPVKAALSMAAITLSAQISTIPLSVIHFRRISLVAVLANLMIFWAVSAVFMMAVLALPLSAVWYWLGFPVARSASPLISYIESCVELLSRVPFAVLGADSVIITLWVFYSYICVFLIYKLKTSRPLLKSAGVVLSSLALSLTLCAHVFYSTFEVRVLSVGNGQCIVITNGGKTAVVDCDSRSSGRAASELIERLKERNITKIDLLILTSLHTQSTSGADDLLGHINAASPDRVEHNLPAKINYELSGRVKADSSAYIKNDLSGPEKDNLPGLEKTNSPNPKINDLPASKKDNLSRLKTVSLSGSKTADLPGRIKIKKLALPFYDDERDFALFVEKTAQKNNIHTMRIAADTVITLGDMVFNIYVPPSGGTTRGCASVCVECGGASVLILGELDVDVQNYMAQTRDIPELAAVVAAKNGAKNATSSEILDKYGVKYVIISSSTKSAGDNPYDFVDEEADFDISKSGIKVLRTGVLGDIKLRFRNGHLRIG